VLAPIAKANGCSPARVSLAWLLAKPVVTSVIIGAKRLDQLQDNLAAVELTLTQDERRQLDEVSAVPPEYPGWLLPFQAADRLQPVDRWERFREARDGVRNYLEQYTGVAQVHDLHIWPMSTTEVALTCHIVTPDGHPGDVFLMEIARHLKEDFGIQHATVQIETDLQSPCALAPDHVV
jgi:hypothetical protein